VARGQGLVIVEAMKMENELKAEGDGRVGKVLVTAGETVEKDQILVEFEAPESAPEKGP
jgi:biotin carboxyl carrier protein